VQKLYALHGVPAFDQSQTSTSFTCASGTEAQAVPSSAGASPAATTEAQAVVSMLKANFVTAPPPINDSRTAIGS
jgi:hypothetical protein